MIFQDILVHLCLTSYRLCKALKSIQFGSTYRFNEIKRVFGIDVEENNETKKMFVIAQTILSKEQSYKSTARTVGKLSNTFLETKAISKDTT